MSTKIQLRRGTAAQWTTVNPVLGQGEIGYEVDTNKYKIGDGDLSWNAITEYFIDGSTIAASISSAVAAEAVIRDAADDAESAARIAADDAESAARIAADSAESAARISADSTEAATRAAADTVLTNTKVSTTDSTIVAINQTKYLDAYVSLAAAISAIGATPTELKVTSAVAVPATATIPATTTLVFEGNGKLTVAAGQTLTIGSMRDPGNKQVLVQGSSSANIRFGPNAVERMNLAWLLGPTATVMTDAFNQLLASSTANGGGRIYIPEGTWTTTGDHELPSKTILEGAGTHQTLAGPTKIKMTDIGAPILKIGANTLQVTVRDLILDGDNQAAVDGFYGTGSEALGDQASSILLERVTITQCVNGVRFYSSAANWLVRAVKLSECLLIDNSFSGFRINTVNNALEIDLCNFGVPAGAYALYFDRVGNANIKNCEFAGLPAYAGTRQVLTNTVVAAAGITLSGNAKCVLTGTAVSGSPRTITVPVTTAQTTATLIADEFRTALAADPEVNRLMKVGGTGADITLTYLIPDANDGTANFTIEDDTSTGIADDLTSNITTSGVSRDGMAEGVCYYSGAHGVVTFQSCQDEALKYFIVNDASDATSITNIQGCLVQSDILLNQSTTLNSFGNIYLSRGIREGTGNSSRITSVGDYVRPTDAYGNTFSPPELAGPFDGCSIVFESPSTTDGAISLRRPTKVQSNLIDVGDPTEPVLTLGNYTTIDEDKILLRLGRTDVYEQPLYYYDLFRDYGTGRLCFSGNQTGFKGYDFDSDIKPTTLSMSHSQGLSGTTGAITMDCSAANNFTVTPTGDCTINSSGLVAGKKYYLTVLTSGASSWNLTFGTGFKTTGVLATGTVTGKYFVVEFYSPDTTNIIELTRTTAL